jgi:ketosteroid isomerase-like protein
MSQENVDLVRRIYDAWDREESARDFISADVEYVNPSYAVEGGIRDGLAVRFRWFQSHSEAFEAAGLEPDA